MYRDGTPYLKYHDIHPRARDTFDSDIRTPLPSSSSRPQGAKRNGHGNGNCKSQSTQGTPSCLALRCSDAPVSLPYPYLACDLPCLACPALLWSLLPLRAAPTVDSAGEAISSSVGQGPSQRQVDDTRRRTTTDH
ncbi:hypothetical protein CPAR01_10949 [Colletotrichum paranaense]|uniref:Uncharacterized protein n=1 Tax=Colletotrichum paranaense TaxID=1914294 RepID=A0ABQ9SA89_9PEZI|nr:uncharacterized protein CPAR01_10949 [Colletotrichum paranaense]KAK1531300.1 hypothetical protein CPAR01_10949 [Colletotrichum paranaense]